MKIYIKSYVNLLILLLLGCASISYEERAFNRISVIVIKQLENEYNLTVFGVGGASWPEKCQFLSFSFKDQSTANISKASEIIVFATQVVIDAVNQNQEFQQYLAEVPFTENHVMLAINFQPQVSVISGIDRVSIAGGIIRYKVWNASTYRYDTILEETYEEALQRLQEPVHTEQP